MILFYYRELRRHIERLEEQHLPKPTMLVYLEAAAAACGAAMIATRNLRDYRNSPIRAARPEEVVRELG